MNPSIHSDRLNRTPSVPVQPDQGFTLIELLVVVGTLTVLALLLVPALAGTKTDSWRTQCQNNLKQLQVGFSLFAQDHNEMYPPAGYQTSSGMLTWDGYIRHYFGDANSDSSWTQGILWAGSSPTMETIELCPADRQPRVIWMYGPGNILQFAPRTYAMVACGGEADYGTLVQVDPRLGLPNINNPDFLGVGIYWASTVSTPDWDAQGYKTSVVKDPGGTILLTEQASSMNAIGNIWPCVSVGPITADGTAGGWGNLYQIDTAAPQNPATLTQNGYNEGQQLYQAHWNRFNYLFHDGHVEALQYTQTVGTTKFVNKPKGMWTVVPGD